MALLKELGINPNGSSTAAAQKKPEMSEHDIATRLQSTYRGHRLRKDLEAEYAAIRLQAIWESAARRVEQLPHCGQRRAEHCNSTPAGSP